MYYLDTSILGAYYCDEILSQVVTRFLSRLEKPLISTLVELEFYSLLSLKVRTGDLTRPQAQSMLARFRTHLASDLNRMVDIGPVEYAAARDWLGRFDSPLRSLDALHLAAASVNSHELLTTDKPFARAARHLGVPCQLLAL